MLSRRLDKNRFRDDIFTLVDEADRTKTMRFQLSGITTGNMRVLTIPDASGIILLDGEIGSSVQAHDVVLDDIAALDVVADNEFIVGTGAGAYAHESGATVRTSLGLGLNQNVDFGTGALTTRDVILGGGVDSDFYINSGAITWMNIYPDGAANGDMCFDVPVGDLDFDVADNVTIYAGGGLLIYLDDDINDYLEISTAANVTWLNFVGQDGKIISSGGHTTVDGVDVSAKAAEFDTHKASTGADHSYIDQDVTVGASPIFDTGTIKRLLIGGVES